MLLGHFLDAYHGHIVVRNALVMLYDSRENPDMPFDIIGLTVRQITFRDDGGHQFADILVA